MRILFDNQIFYTQKYGGVSRYFAELIKNIKLFSDAEAILPTTLSDNVYFSNRYRIPLGIFYNIDFRGRHRLFCAVNTRFSKHALMDDSQYDIFHPTYYDPYHLSLDIKKPVVITVHDMIHELFPSYFSIKDKTTEYKKKLLERADKIICISETTKKDLCKLLHINNEKISVIHLGTSFSEILPKKIALPDRYLLFVGGRHGYKNFNLLIRSIATLLKDHRLALFCAGGGAFNAIEKKLLSEYGLKKHVFQKNVNDRELKFCYKNTLAFIFPSLYEGFGIPIIEAFSCGCPVLLSNTSCLPEIAGEAGLYFNPCNPESIAAMVSTVLNKNFDRESVVRKGFLISKNFTWKKTAEKTLDTYRELL